MQADFLPTLKTSLMVWPPANLVNYQFVPADKRILFISCISLAWNVFIRYSSINARG